MSINSFSSLNKAKLFQLSWFFIIIFAFNNIKVSKASANNTLYDEEVSIMPLRDDCSTLEPIKKYSVRKGEIEGILYTTVCFNGNSLPNALVDEFKYTFIDTGGTNSERCYGIVDISTPSAIRHKWQFLGTVPGYTCSKTGKTILRYYPKGY